MSSRQNQLDEFQNIVAHILKTKKENVKTFNVELKHKFPPQIDVRFFVKEDSQYFKPVRLDGILQMHRQQVILSTLLLDLSV